MAAGTLPAGTARLTSPSRRVQYQLVMQLIGYESDDDPA